MDHYLDFAELCVRQQDGSGAVTTAVATAHLVSARCINRSLVDHCILTSSFFTRGHFLIGQNIIKNHTLKDSGGNILVVSMCVCSHVRNASDQLRDHSFVQMNMET